MENVDAQLLTTAYREVGEMYRTFIGLQKFVWSMYHAGNAAIVTGIIYLFAKEHEHRIFICC